MTLKCNGCGGEFDLLGGTFSWGRPVIHTNGPFPDEVHAHYHKTLCPRCQRVMKDILLNSDLSDQWEEFDWEQLGDKYTEGYDDETA